MSSPGRAEDVRDVGARVKPAALPLQLTDDVQGSVKMFQLPGQAQISNETFMNIVEMLNRSHSGRQWERE